MTTVTTHLPMIGGEGFFEFKEPFSLYINNKYNIDYRSVMFKVSSIISLRDNIKADLKDPFITLYEPVGLTEVDYKLDLQNNIPLISFSFTSDSGTEEFFRVPLNYVEEVPTSGYVDYINRTLVVDLGPLPNGLELEGIYGDLRDFISERVGVSPDIKDIALGTPSKVYYEEHEIREEVRKNNTSVFETDSIKLSKLQEIHNNLLRRLDELDIVLG